MKYPLPTLFVCCFLTYLMGAFYATTFDIRQWSDGLRFTAMFLFFCYFLCVVMTRALHGEQDENNTKG